MNLRSWLPFVLLIFPIFSVSARTPRDRNGAQDEATSTNSAREDMGLRGPVKSCTETWAFDGRAFSMYNEFAPDGKLLVSRSENPDGSEWVTTWTYDENGRVLKSTSGKSGETPSETIYTYDDQGRLVSVTNSKNNDRTDIHYYERGHKTQIQTFDPKTLQTKDMPHSTARVGLPSREALECLPEALW